MTNPEIKRQKPPDDYRRDGEATVATDKKAGLRSAFRAFS
jgi:hypothetical protein